MSGGDTIQVATARNLFSVDEGEHQREKRHARTQMKRALESLHDVAWSSAEGCSSFSSSDDEPSPRRAPRGEGSVGPRRLSTGLSGLVDKTLSTRRHSVRLDQISVSPLSAAHCASPDTPAGELRDRACTRLIVTQWTPAGKGSTNMQRGDSLMKISRDLCCESLATPQDTTLQPPKANANDADDRSATKAAQDDVQYWAALLQRCHATKVLLPIGQPVPRDMMDSASSLKDVNDFCGDIASSFSIFLSSCSTSNDNSQSMASQCSAEDADSALQGTLDTLLCTP